MARITNEVLAEKIDTVHIMLTEMKCDVKENTEFRLQFKGALAMMVAISGTIAAGISYLITKLRG